MFKGTTGGKRWMADAGIVIVFGQGEYQDGQAPKAIQSALDGARAKRSAEVARREGVGRQCPVGLSDDQAAAWILGL